MRSGESAAVAAGVVLVGDERVVPFGEGWLIADRKGFRPCPWAFELAAFADVPQGARVLDLGCGGGALLLAAAQLAPEAGALVGLELDVGAAEQARRNLRLAARAGLIVRGDVREAPVPPRVFDRVIANPPFYPPGWGRQSQHVRTHASTHALAGDVRAFARAAAHALAPHGRAVFVYDAGHLAALLLALADATLTVRSLRFLDDDRGVPARVLALAGHAGGGLAVSRAQHAPDAHPNALRRRT